MSEASVTWAPVACSGDTYMAVPMTMPVSVRCDAWAAATAVAMPKSVIFVVPPAATSRLPGLVRHVERSRRLADDVQGGVRGEPFRPGQDGRQRLAVDQLHDQVSPAELGGLAVVVDPGDARVGQAGRVPRLGPDPGQERLVAGPPGGQQLDRHGPVEQAIFGTPDLTHAAGRDAVGQPVTPGQQIIAH